MEVASCVQTVVNAATAYQSNPSDNNQVQLQRQLDYLISLTARDSSLSFFNPREMLPTECLSFLVDILDNSHSRPSLAQSIMLLFDNLAHKPELQHALHSTYNLTSCLARFLDAQTETVSAADPNSLLCLKLLHKVTYECKVSFQEAYVEDLIGFLVTYIQENDDELTPPCIGLVANLCRNNLPVQMVVKNMPAIKAFNKRLANLLSHKNNHVVVSALSTLVSLRLCKDEGIFSAKNINQIFQLLFNVLSSSGGYVLRKYTVNVFIDLLKNTKIQQYLSVYSHLDSCLAQLLSMLQTGSGDDITKLLELLMSLCSVSGVRCSICRRLLHAPSHAQRMGSGDQSDVFPAIIHWVSQGVDTHSDAPLLALDFLREMYEEILDQGLLPAAGPRTELVLPVLLTTLSQAQIPDGITAYKHCRKLVKALQLAILLTSDSSLKPVVGALIAADQCMDLIEHQLHNNAVGLKGMRWSPSDNPHDWSEEGVSVLLHTLDLMIILRKDVRNMDQKLTLILQDARLVSYLSHGMTCGQRELIQIVLRIISHGTTLPQFPLSVLGDCMSAQLNQQQTRAKEQKEITIAKPQLAPPVWNKENLTPDQFGRRNSHNVTSASKFNPLDVSKLDTTVETLIEKMQNSLELKDVRSSQVISIYEHKIQSLQTKETHLQDLLEAKVLAMAQADRLITQYRCRQARTEAEAQKMRSLLQDFESKHENYREQLNEATLERERLGNDIEQMAQDNARLEAIAEEHKDLNEAYTQQSQRLENVQRSLVTLKQEHHSLSEMHDMLRRHNETLKQQNDVASQQLVELDDERKTLSKQLKDKEGKLHDTSKTLTRTEKDLKKMTNECDGFEKAVDTMRNQLTQTEHAKKDLQKKVSVLELQCRKHETQLKDKEKQIHDQKEDIEKHAKIHALIRDITSGKEPS